MECVIADSSGIRTLSKVAQCAAKIGEDVTFTLAATGLRIRVVNASKSALADFHMRRAFFSSFPASSGPAAPACVSARALLPIFRSPGAITSLRILLDARNARLVLRVTSRTALRKTFRIPVHDGGAAPAALFDKAACASFLQTRPRFFLDILANFHARLDEITLALAPAGVRVSSFVDSIAAADPHRAMLRTEMEVPAREFDVYRVSLPARHALTPAAPATPATPETVPEDVSLTFYCKPFRAALEFCEIVEAPLSVWFSSSGHPIIFASEYGAPGGAVHFDATFVFATRLVRDSSQSQTPASSENPTQSRGSAPSSAGSKARGVRPPASAVRKPRLAMTPDASVKPQPAPTPPTPLAVPDLSHALPSSVQRPPVQKRRASPAVVEHGDGRDGLASARAGARPGSAGSATGASRIPDSNDYGVGEDEDGGVELEFSDRRKRDVVLPTQYDYAHHRTPVHPSVKMHGVGVAGIGDSANDYDDDDDEHEDDEDEEYVAGTPPPE